jgi:diguanylate cyclase (GGDEF)-like protein
MTRKVIARLRLSLILDLSSISASSALRRWVGFRVQTIPKASDECSSHHRLLRRWQAGANDGHCASQRHSGLAPPTGIAIAAFLIIGYDVWPSILLASFLVNITTAGSVVTCLGIATGNTLEGLVGAFLVNQFAAGRKAMNRPQDIFKFAGLAGMVSTGIGATFGVTSLALNGYANWGDFLSIWSTWWLGDAVGAVVIAPLLILWISDPHLNWRWNRVLEAVGLLVCVVLVGLIVFDGFFVSGTKNYPLEYLCIPFLIWAGFRFGPREVTVATLALSGTAIWGTLHGFGPFARGSRNESPLLLQSFLGSVAVVTMAFAAAFTELRRAEEHAQKLAVSDSLTGLANLRKLIDTLEAETRRSGRTGRTFALLLMDLDGLKKINDVHGHVVGSRTLCRLAHVLQCHSRNTDTAARYGGDEFALVLTEAGMGAARQVAHRIVEQLASDGEEPGLSVSIGEVVCPQDGESSGMLLRAADRDLYENKRQPHGQTVNFASAE